MENNRTKQQMKKTLLVALAVMMSAAAFAQFTAAPRPMKEATFTKDNVEPRWTHIADPFVANDINGNPVSLQAILDSGQFVVIDYSACWCGPCWNFHNSGVLEAIDAMDSVTVIWVEIEEENTTAQIYGPAGGSGATQTYGNWTLDANGQPVPYPIIDDDANRTCLRTCAKLYEGYVPSVYFITPDGFYCNLYGESYGVSTNTSHDQAVAAIRNLMNICPAAGRVPAVYVEGRNKALFNTPVELSLDICSPDPIRRISWTIEGGNPATSSDESVNVIWSTAGNHTVTAEVTNDNGSTTITYDVQIVEWGNTMTYSYGDYYTSIGLTNGGAFSWGAKYPASVMSGRQFLKNAELYVGDNSAGSYTMTVYQGGENAPETQIYTRTYNLNQTGWNTLNVSGAVALDQNKSLWVVFSASNVQYPAACGVDYFGSPDGSLLYLNGQWLSLPDAGYENTWMIKVTTGDEGNAGISTLETAKVAIYPNPATDKVTVVADNLSKVEVLDVTGRIVATTNQSVVDMSSLQNGVYMFRVITANGTTMQKVVKK